MIKLEIFLLLLLVSCAPKKEIGYSNLLIEKEIKLKQIDNLPIAYQLYREGISDSKIYYQLDPKDFLSMRDSSGLWSVSMAVELKIKSNQIGKSTLLETRNDTVIFDSHVIKDSICFSSPTRKDIILELSVIDLNKHVYQEIPIYWERDFDFISEDISLWNEYCNCNAQGSFVAPRKVHFKSERMVSEIFTLELYENIFQPALKMYDIGKNDFYRGVEPNSTLSGTLNVLQNKANEFSEAFFILYPREQIEKQTRNSFEFTVQQPNFNYNIAPLVYLVGDEIGTSDVHMNQWLKFWSKASNDDPKTAENLIKVFSKRVEYADDKFSCYKSGWKTDRGMMYILLGKPDRIQNDVHGEVWIYGFTESSERQYIFERNPLGLHENDYVLERSLNYREVWQSALLKWENGWVKEDISY